MLHQPQHQLFSAIRFEEVQNRPQNCQSSIPNPQQLNLPEDWNAGGAAPVPDTNYFLQLGLRRYRIAYIIFNIPFPLLNRTIF